MACAIPDCEICREVAYLRAIAAKCTPDERAFLNGLYAQLEAAEMELAWRETHPAPDVVVDGERR
jgi:hypothetical protein